MWPYALPGVIVIGVVIALLAGSPPFRHASLRVQQPPAETNTPALTATPASTPTTQPVPFDQNIVQQNQALTEQRDNLQVQVQALAGQLADETKSLDDLRAKADQARQEIATLQAQQGDIVFLSAQSALAQLRRGTPRHPPAAAARVTAPASPGTPVRTRLMAARIALTGGDTTAARALIEAAQTQLVFQPVSPDQPEPPQSNNPATSLLGQALGSLNAGQTATALNSLDHAIASLDTSSMPTTAQTPRFQTGPLSQR